MKVKEGTMRSFVLQTAEKIRSRGEPIRDIICYWLPEMITSMILVALPPLVDSYIVSNSQSITSYGALAMTSNFIHTLIKMAEGIPIASIAIIGRYNGAKEYPKCGKELGNTFWTTVIVGLALFVLILLSSTMIFRWLGVPEEMVPIGARFLMVRSCSIPLIFIFFSFVGFMRAVKNTKTPMVINMFVVATFILFEYSLVLGKFGFPKLDLTGAAIATIIQYTVMNLIALGYILLNTEYKKYFSQMFFTTFQPKRMLTILNLSWPILIDKISFASSYIWLSKMIATMGTYAITSYDVVKNLERFAFLPAVAFAQVITFLVSNRLGAKDPNGASANIKKVLMLTGITVSIALSILCIKAPSFIHLFDPKNEFTDFASIVLPVISILVIFDFVQVILAGALRGAGDVKAVMYGRFFSCLLFFWPISYLFSQMTSLKPSVRFVLIYGSHYLNAGVMGIIFLYRIMSHKWQEKDI
jgi:putative MATE family efflux protein